MKRLLGTFDAVAPAPEVLDAVVSRALEEDAAFTDRSTLPLPARGELRRARVVAREEGVLAGAEVFRRTFELVAGRHAVSCSGLVDGDRFRVGEDVLRLEAPAGVLLSGERTALNFLQRLSGIATLTARAVQAVGERIAVCDTRKTTPGLRALEKWAVVVGGGTSHRWSLDDMVMLKENHLTLAGGIGPAIRAIRADPESSRRPVTVEVVSFEQAMEAAGEGVDRILLDNMTPAAMGSVAEALGPDRPELEASGGIRLEDLPAVADSGVDLVSLGSLTHSARAIDLSMLIEDGA